uniref:GSKIP_dom domain-containing protein n=2 Tax=Panagrellus redivivus TaxID=6233 RepID=A0A7E4UWV6_PANRE
MLLGSARWQSAAHVYQSSRAVSPVPGSTSTTLSMTTDPLERENICLSPHILTQTLLAQTGVSTPINLEEIAAVNRKRHFDSGLAKLSHAEGGPLELEAIAAVHELGNVVRAISVSEILPRTPDLIFVNVKTIDDHPYTLELTMKGWRIASPHTDSMNGDYTQIDMHTTYFENARQVLQVISPTPDQCFHDKLAEKLSHVKDNQNDEASESNR